jgi:cephalosporin-C deacetylase
MLAMSTALPERHKSSVVKPVDFDVFWDGTLAEMEEVSTDFLMEPVPIRSTSEVEVFEAHYESYGGLEIAGWYARPRGANHSLPALLQVPGYAGEPTLPSALAALGYAVFSVAPRGKLRSNGVFNPGYPGLLIHNIDNRDNYGYRGFYMDALRAFDLLAGLPEVDPGHIGVLGSSQGGALTLLVSSLRAGSVKAASVGAPYLCSIMDAASLTRSYPYEEINDYLRLHPERRETVRSVLNYYDIHNFVDRITCPIIVNIGLRDDVCPPETGYAIFDAVGSVEKRLYTYNDCAHDAGGGLGHENIVMDFMAKHLKEGPM